MLLQQARDRVRSQHAPRIPRAQMLDGLIGQPAANRAEVSCLIACKSMYADSEFPSLCKRPRQAAPNHEARSTLVAALPDVQLSATIKAATQSRVLLPVVRYSPPK